MLSLPSYVKKALNLLHSKGYEAYCVGGCVRDLVMGIIPNDYDLTTNATPLQLSSIFNLDSKFKGLKYGTVRAIIDNNQVEITTYRIENEYSADGKPLYVKFTNNIVKDLNRRDFTVNSICYDGYNILDPLLGIKDIKNKTLICIGDPEFKFKQDPLRILRLFRFSAELNFYINNKTYYSALDLSNLLNNLSVSRISTELTKIILTGKYKLLNPIIYKGGFNKIGISNISFIKNYDFSNIGYPNCYLPLLLSNNIQNINFIDKILLNKRDINLLKSHYNVINNYKFIDNDCLKRLTNLYNIDFVKENLFLRQAIYNIDFSSQIKYLDYIIDNNIPYNISMLDISSYDIKNLGVADKYIGKVKNYLFEQIIKNPNYNRYYILSKLVKNFYFNMID